MTVTYDLSTDQGLVRLIIGDTDVSNPIFQDAEIGAFLNLKDGVVKLAAAQALETMATNQVMTLKVIKTLDLSTDGASVSRALRLAADELRAEVAQDDVNSGQGFDWAETTDTTFARHERRIKQILKYFPS